ncbi:MAG: HAD-IA family hydrolase [Boseongicola sp.]|nr:HAD-IA family hydrolase [Boseongicola sp.]
MKTVVFDLDGTLADTSADLIAAANACFEARGLGPLLDKELDKSTAFRGGRAMLTLGYSRLERSDLAELVESDYPRLLSFYGEHIDNETFFYPGAVSAVERLRSNGFKTSICTNKPEGLARTLMSRLGASDLFDALIGADTLPVRKPNPTPLFEAVSRSGGVVDRSVLIGDTETDEKTARAAGVPLVLVGFGPEGDAVKRLNPDHILNDYKDLQAVVEALIA